MFYSGNLQMVNLKDFYDIFHYLNKLKAKIL